MQEEFLKDNQDELNQLSKKLLKKVKEQPEPKWLYCLQLANWSLESGNIEASNDLLPEHLDALLVDWSPENAWKFLSVNDSGDEEDLVSYAEGKKEAPLNVAVLDQLDSRLSASMNGYPKPPGLPAKKFR